jgi:signal transduction histidine kinase
MKLKSISRRVYRSILIVSMVSMVAMFTAVLLVNEDLEHTMLDVEFAQERDFILKNLVNGQQLIWQTPHFSVAYLPRGTPVPPNLPSVFHGLPDNYSSEIEKGSETYLVAAESSDTGKLYIAKNITHFEHRESLFQAVLLVLTLVILGISLLLAILSSRRIVRPLRMLSEQISSIPVGQNMPRIQTDYPDAELHLIATIFNQFLGELESFVQREQSLLSLASHELRTPIAVMSGALDVLEVRNQLNTGDQATLERIRRSCNEMGDNVNILLKLARREPVHQEAEMFSVSAVLDQAIEDLEVSHRAGNRMTLDIQNPMLVKSDQTMVRMLLRNLIQNALQHTSGEIHINVSSSGVEIRDQGTGLNPEQQTVLLGKHDVTASRSTLGGFGLYIVSLMVERLHWKLEITETTQGGTTIRLHTRHKA